MKMRKFHCPHCKKLLFQGYFADIEMKCTRSSCGRYVRIKVYTASALILTADETSDMIEAYKRSTEVNEPDRDTVD